MKKTRLLLLFLLVDPCLAQNTCFTDPEGTTICSTPDTVIHGNTNSTGQSIYRDDRGNLLEFESDPSGNSSVQLPTGNSINWSTSPPLPQQQEGQTGVSPLPRLLPRELPGSAEPGAPPQQR